MQSVSTTSTAFLAAERQFLQEYPEYESTAALGSLRGTEYARLDRLGQIYLDYTGGGLYADSQVVKHMDLLRCSLLGNPHSSNPSSIASTHLVEAARASVLEFFHASPQEYTVIFTQNASGALKLVGESFPFTPDSRYLLTFDNHNSVNGIREFARARGASIEYVPVTLPEMRVNEASLIASLDNIPTGQNSLFAFPAQSNFSGAQHPLEWIEMAQSRGWKVLVDGAAFVPSNPLDLSRWHPDFVPLSFYKMFGYPSGIGCLLARKTALAVLHRPWFAGGTITVASVQGDAYYLAPGEAAFEEGTLNYLGLPAVKIGLDHLTSIGMENIHTRVSCLTGWLLENLQNLRYDNNRPLIRLYGPCTNQKRGGTIALNFRDNNGFGIDHRLIEAAANQVNISLRTGCFCNPGAGEVALEITRPELVTCFSHATDQLTLDEFRVCIDGKNSGAVRISVGLASNFADVYQMVEFARSFLTV